MPLFQSKPARVIRTETCDDGVAAKIKQRRYQILVHSLLYYELDVSLVSDHKWSEWANELVTLQNQYPHIAKTVIFADAFRAFDGSTGFDLPFRDEQIVNIAYRLLKSSAGDYVAESNAIRGVDVIPAEYKGFYDNQPQRSVKAPAKSNRKAVSKVEPTKRKKLF